MKSVPVIAFDYRVSRLLIAAIALATSMAMVALASCGFPLVVKLIGAAIAFVYASIAMRRFLRSSPRRAAWHAAGHWRLAHVRGEDHVAELLGSAIRSAWIVLNLRESSGRRIDLILGPDNSDAETRRQLRVRLSRSAEISRA